MNKEEKIARDSREQEFYTKCSELLNVGHDYHVPYPYKTRWNTRILGNGRYPGFGTIRCFGPTIIVMSRKHGTKTFNKYEEVYEFLGRIA